MTVRQFIFRFWLNYQKDALDTFVPVAEKINPMKGAQCLPSADAAVRNLAIGQKHRDEPWFINCPLAQLFHGLGNFFVHVAPRPLTVLGRETRDEEIALYNLASNDVCPSVPWFQVCFVKPNVDLMRFECLHQSCYVLDVFANV